MEQIESPDLPVFRVRDISQHYSEPTFDIVFYDEASGVCRHSDSVWGTRDDAELVADRLERDQAMPAHWEIVNA